MRSRTVFVAVALVGALAAPAAAEDRGTITATLDFALGSSSVGDAEGFLAPGGHFDVGFRVRRWRLAAELDSALWSNPSAVEGDPPQSGSFRRVGMALRWNAMDVYTPPRDQRPGAAYRIYVEAGLGRQRVDTPSLDITRSDLMLGVGVAPEITFGRFLFGGNFGIRVLISNAPDDPIARTVCGDCGAPASRHDLTLLYVFGFTMGT